MRERAAGRLGKADRFRLPTANEWRAVAGIPMPSLGTLKLSPPPEVVVEGSGPLVLEKSSALIIQQLDGSVSEWTSTPGLQPGSFIVCGACWVEGVAPNGSSIIRAYEGNLRGVGLGFRIALELKPSTNLP